MKHCLVMSLALGAAFGCGSERAATSSRPAAPRQVAAPATASVNLERTARADDRMADNLLRAVGADPIHLPELHASALSQMRAQQAMIAFQSLAEEMCSCSNSDCATVVAIRIEALGEAYGDLEANAFSQAQQEDLMLAATQMAECQNQINRGAF